jgi:hypothetical protein
MVALPTARLCMQGIKTETHLLRSQCSFPKWNGRESHQRPVGCLEAAPLCQTALVTSSELCLMALCPMICCSPEQRLTNLKEGQSKLELFSGTWVGSNMKFMHTFGCPVFALQNALASGKSIPRWDLRAPIGLNLGPSSMHATNVHFVLSLTTGLVTPHFHCCFDDFFKTCKYTPQEAGILST